MKELLTTKRSRGLLSRLLPERNGIVQNAGHITAQNIAGVNCVYHLTLNGCDPSTAMALAELGNEYRALRLAIGRLITVIEQKGGAR